MSERELAAARREGYIVGIRAVAQFVGEWDRQIRHPFRFEDVILYKFNLRKTTPRRKRVSHE